MFTSTNVSTSAELGVLDLLTSHGVATRYPIEADRRRRLGKLVDRREERELGGRRSSNPFLRDSLAREHLDKRVLLVSHEVVIVIWRYLVEDLDEAGALALSRTPAAELFADAVREGWQRSTRTRSRRLGGAPLESADVPVTEEHDAHVAPR